MKINDSNLFDFHNKLLDKYTLFCYNIRKTKLIKLTAIETRSRFSKSKPC